MRRYQLLLVCAMGLSGNVGGGAEVLMDLMLRPELVHMAMNRLVSAYLSRLEQWENLGLLTIDSGNYEVGSGCLEYTDGLPQKDFNPSHIRPIDQWGSATAQIFSEVSPEMHEEFALQYERHWLGKSGLTYYGCREPLHNKYLCLRPFPICEKFRAVRGVIWIRRLSSLEQIM